MLKIGIIDSGVDIAHPKLGNYVSEKLISGVQIARNAEGEIVHLEEYDDTIGHGTACTGIIRKFVGNAQLLVVKIFRDQGITDDKILIEAIKYCVAQQVDLINVSLGIQTDAPDGELKKICDKAFNQGITIVAAEHNGGLESYPAHYPNVIGVMSGNTKKSQAHGFLPQSPVEFTAKGGLQRVIWKSGGYNITSGTSYACPHLTGIIGQAMLEKGLKGPDQVKAYLVTSASADVPPLYQRKEKGRTHLSVVSTRTLQRMGKKYFAASKFGWMGRLAVFPVSEKELTTVVKFRHLAPAITTFVDYPRNLSKKAIEGEVLSKKLGDADFDRFDTLVTGYFHEHLFEGNVNYGLELVQEAILRDKNFFVFDINAKTLVEKKVAEAGRHNKIYLPGVGDDTFQDFIHFKHLPEAQFPVVAVIGTSSRQGKFTTQLRIREVLESHGYRVGHVSTEPHGELLGASFAFPIGYNGTVGLPPEERVLFLKYLMKGMQAFVKPHLVVTGIQGGVVPRTRNYTGDFTAALTFLYGTQPDALICAINPEDSLQEIGEHVQTAQLYTRAKVIFYCLIPFRKSFTSGTNSFVTNLETLTQVEYEEKRVYFARELGAEVINVMDKRYDRFIFERIINSFS